MANRLSGRNRDRLALPLVSVSLVFAVFAIASAHRWAVVVGAGLSILSTLPYWGSRRTWATKPPLLVFLGVCAGLTALQLLPLPAALVGFLSPAKYSLIVDNAAALQQSPPGFFALTLDPSATLRELVKLVGYLGFAYTCLRLASKKGEKTRTQLVQLVVWVGSLVALSALVHKVVGATTLFGVYDPEFITKPILMSPLLNTNHLAGLMALCASAALGLVVHHRGTYRYVSIAALLLCSGVGVLSESRGGVIVLGIGVLLTTLFCFIQKKQNQRDARVPQRVPIAQVVVGVCIFVLLAVTTGAGVLEQLSNTSADEITGRSEKVDLWRTAGPLVKHYPLTGIGRGAFEQAISQVRPSSQFSFASLENEYLQAIVDWGLPGALLAAIALLMLLIAAARQWRMSPIDAGCLAGLVALGVQSMVDFGLSLPGVALPAVVLLSVLTKGTLEVVSSARETRRKGIHSGLVLLAAVAVVILALPRSQEARRESCSDPCSVQSASEIWARHPADYRAAGKTAMALYAGRDGRAMAVLNRAMVANPTQWGLHLLAARWLAPSNPKQSRLEYASALRFAPADKLGTIVEELISTTPDPTMAAQGLPRDGTWLRRINGILRSQNHLDVSLAHAIQLMEFPHANLEVLEVVTNIAIESKEFDLALRAARRAYEIHLDATTVLYLARAEFGAGNNAKAKEVLAEAVASRRYSGVERVGLIQMEAKILISESSLQEARSRLNDALHIPGAGNRAKARIHRQLAEVEHLLGNRNQAAQERQMADKLRR